MRAPVAWRPPLAPPFVRETVPGTPSPQPRAPASGLVGSERCRREWSLLCYYWAVETRAHVRRGVQARVAVKGWGVRRTRCRQETEYYSALRKGHPAVRYNLHETSGCEVT